MKFWKVWIANKLLEHLFKAPTQNKFLRIEYTNTEQTKGRVYVGTELLTESESKNLGIEARTILKLGAYTKLQKSLQQTAQDMLFNKAKTVDDMLFAKAMLYTLDVMNTKLKNLSKLN